MILLDTHVWVRWLDPDAMPLPRGVIERIETADQLAVSAISCWEVAWLSRRGRLDLTLGGMKQAQPPLFQREELVAGFWMLHGTRNNPSTVGADRVRDLIRGPIKDAEGLCLHHTVRAYRVAPVSRQPPSPRRRTAFTESRKWQNSIPRPDLEAAYRTDMPNTMINQNHSAAENKQ